MLDSPLDCCAGASIFLPVLTVLPEFGGPFIWIARRPDVGGVGPCLCDSMGWSDTYPLSEGLFLKFADWEWSFESAARDEGYCGDLGDDWDWAAFHARGLQLSRWLKEEVEGAYRVVYMKASEDPNYRDRERAEILADGTLLALPPSRGPRPGPPRFCERIVSGGQTGADRGALDFAIRHGYLHGGWTPPGRLAEDGIVPIKYQLTEMAQGGYRQRTRQNVQDSDATLIVNLGTLDGGTLATQRFARKADKPCLVVQADSGFSNGLAHSILAWLYEHDVKILNVAGPRESKRPGVGLLTGEILAAMDSALRSK